MGEDSEEAGVGVLLCTGDSGDNSYVCVHKTPYIQGQNFLYSFSKIFQAFFIIKFLKYADD